MTIGGFLKFSLIDYPDRLSAVIFTQGCNFRCGYCHNSDLIAIKKKSVYDPNKILGFLKKRQGKLEAVVITGGEPTLQSDLEGFIKEIKRMKYLVKLDTNGSNPEVLEKLTNKALVDYVAMDIKAPFEKYQEITQVKPNFNAIKKSISNIKESKILYEFRTTVAKGFLSVKDIINIGKMLKNSTKFTLQGFRSVNVINSKYVDCKKYQQNELLNIKTNLRSYIDNVGVRF